jgi:molybdenum cofactor cytidylyltransferase
MHIGALLLAAGFSSRFGGVKQLATLDSGARVFEQTYARLQVAVPEIVVLTRPELSSELDAKARRVEVFTEAERGMGATLAYGMQFIGCWDACMICLSDMPFIATDTYRTLAEQATSDLILLPECDGKTGNPVVFGSAFFSALGNLSGDAGGKVLIRQHPDKVITLKLQDQAILMDIDTPQDLAQLQASQA